MPLALTPRLLALLVLAASAGILLTAFGFQYIGGLQPCVLCLYQRWPYAIAIALGLIALFMPWAAGRWLIALAVPVFAVGAGIALFHVGVEQHWWQGTAECGGSIGSNLSLEELKAQILAAPVVRCDEVSWSLFGISMAGYNILLGLGLAAATTWGLRQTWRAR